MTKPATIHFKSAGARRMPAPDYSTKRGEAFVAWLIDELDRNPNADIPRLIERKQTGA